MGWAKDPAKRAAQEANLAKGRQALAKKRSQGVASPAKRRSQPAQQMQPTAPAKPAKPAKPAAVRKPAAAKAPAKAAASASQTRKRGFLSGLFGGG